MTTFNFNTLCAGRSLTTEESQALFTQVFEGKIDLRFWPAFSLR